MMSEFNAMTSSQQINTLCDVHECSKRIRKVHFDQYVNSRCNAHPPQAFVNWWARQGWHEVEEATQRAWHGIEAVTAFNCEAVRAVYREWKSIGSPLSNVSARLLEAPRDPILGDEIEPF